MSLLSTQHWVQSAQDHYPKSNGTWCATYHDKVTLFWNQGTHLGTVTLHKGTNVTIFRSATGFSKFDIFMRRRTSDRPPHRLVCKPAETNVSDEEINHIENMRHINFNNISIPGGDTNLYAQSDQNDLLCWHYRLNHISFKILKLMAILEIIPKKLEKIKSPKCAWCTYQTPMDDKETFKPKKDSLYYHVWSLCIRRSNGVNYSRFYWKSKMKINKTKIYLCNNLCRSCKQVNLFISSNCSYLRSDI